MTKLVVEGHGEWATTHPEFKVPDSVEIVIFQGTGVGLDDSHGISIAKGKGLPVHVPTAYDAVNNEYDTEPPATGGLKVPGVGVRKVYRAGDMCPNFKLFSWNHPVMGALTVTGGTYKINYNAALPNYYEDLSLIAATHKGCHIEWAACTVER